ncbi:hypothetical protein [Bradyrhizobium sp. RDI18]|uniref:hypothetical protein n=1 Tax=Bradyrhizobium sp. RDI18 TaxID=3367400 RepID=UPI00370FD81C
MDELPLNGISLQPAISELGDQAAQGEVPLIRPKTQTRCSPEIAFGPWPPILPGATLPVSRCRRTHPTAVLTATPSCLAASLQDNPPGTTYNDPLPKILREKTCPSMLAFTPRPHGKSEFS